MIPKALCAGCGKLRAYSSKEKAKSAERRGIRCKSCANALKNYKPRRMGFSEAEFNQIKMAAQSRKKYWNLSLTDIHDAWERQNGTCTMTGVPMRKAPRTWSVDRIDNSCGYTPGNIQLVLKHINMMRGSLSVEDFVELCQAVVSHRSPHETN